ncbi:hypothetical protein [uncultured Bifidobacterium sp.]|uniref:hypothetical protein n=1 Tax=uncultured Bifidobacterium sp. TaxID=165187 RepID=UPI0028DAF815|nr:hypothetical protein [uncultured Bifidobacterium sp.]
MRDAIDDMAIASAAMLPEVRRAAMAGAGLMSLWPLTDADRLANDAKYTENLRMRVTRVLAGIMTGEEVTVADAEYVVDGADMLPGRPETVMRALLAANDAYDAMSDYGRTGDVAAVMRAAGMLGVDWGDGLVRAVSETLDIVDTTLRGPQIALPRTSDDEETISQRLAAVAVACDGLLGTIADAADAGAISARLCLPVVPYANELCERLAIPRLFIDAEGLAALVSDRADPGDGIRPSDAVARLLAGDAVAEWGRHREAVLWDPEESRRQAQADDDGRRRQELDDRLGGKDAGSAAAA